MTVVARVEYAKPALTFEQQLDALEGRGMTIGDRVAATKLLSQVSYYRLSAYWHPFRVAPDSDAFRSETSLAEVARIYDYDRRLRLQVATGIEKVEVATRTASTYVLAHSFGPFAHASASSFREDFNHRDWCDQLDEEVQKVKTQLAFLDHFEKRYLGFPRVPIWMATEVLTFGRLSKLVRSGLREEERRQIAAHLDVHPSLLPSWLQALSTARNICAHHGRLWNRHMGVSPKIPKDHPGWVGVHKSRVYATILMVRRLLSSSDGGAWWDSTLPLIEEADAHLLNAMSVPTDWRDRPPP